MRDCPVRNSLPLPLFMTLSLSIHAFAVLSHRLGRLPPLSREPTMAAAIRGSSFLLDALRVSSSHPQSVGSQAARLLQRRGMAGGGDHHGPPKVNAWQDPLSPSKWKEEHFVIVSLTGWGLLIYGGFKLFSGGKKEKALEGNH